MRNHCSHFDNFPLAAKCAKDEVCLVSMHGCVSAQTGFALELPTRWHLFLLFWRVSEICVSFSHPTDGFLPAMAIAAVLGGDSRIYSRGNHHEGLFIGFTFTFGITSSDALEQLIQDILLNTEALGSTLGVTAANANISPHAASIRRAWHESWALCHGTAQISSGQRTCMGPTLLRRGSRWRHKTSYARHSGQTNQGNCSTQIALQDSGIGHWSTTP